MSFDPVALIRDFAGVTNAQFPDLTFLSPRGELSIEVHEQGVKRVRIRLPGVQFLHLHSIEIDAEGVDDLFTQTTLTASSHAEQSEQHLVEGLLFDSESTHVSGFHTGQDQDPWLDITFERVVDISRLLLRNVNGLEADRAVGLQVLVAGNDGELRLIHDLANRVAELANAIDSVVAHSPHTNFDGAIPLLDLLRAIVTGDRGNANARLKAVSAIDAEQTHAVKKAVSELILADRNLEWTSHGIQRSFRFWASEDRIKYVATAVKLVDDLQLMSPNACFGFGSVLAAVREGDLIDHDDDLDLIIGFEPAEAATLSDGLELVRIHLQALGYRVWGEETSFVFVAKDETPKIDVFVGIFEDDAIAWFPGMRGSLQREDMFPTSESTVLGQRCQLPRNPTIYLDEVYGQSWRIPDAGFVHHRSRSEYADISGVETPAQARRLRWRLLLSQSWQLFCQAFPNASRLLGRVLRRSH